jgi:hypothetical protein
MVGSEFTLGGGGLSLFLLFFPSGCVVEGLGSLVELH